MVSKFVPFRHLIPYWGRLLSLFKVIAIRGSAATEPSQQDEGSTAIGYYQLKVLMIIFVGFWAFFLAVYLSSGQVDHVMRSVLTFERTKEFLVLEHLSRFYIFLAILVSVQSYSVVNDRTKLKLSICFLAFGLTLYLAESHMIHPELQAVFGAIILVYAFFLLVRSYSWLALLLLLLGIGLIVVGFTHDLVEESETVRSILPHFLVRVIVTAGNNVGEETFEAIGLGLVFLSMLTYFRIEALDFLKGNSKGALLLVVAGGLIAVGDGFLAWQYDPELPKGGGLLIALSGFAIFVLVNNRLIGDHVRLRLISEGYLYISMFFFFIILPAVFDRPGHVRNFVLWAPTMSMLIVYLYRRHPITSVEAANRAPGIAH